MAERIAHRGPDHFGVWFEFDAGVVLAHRRLAILDLSSAGNQPMVSMSGRYVITFNGEIYNHLLLRKELESESWRGHSDTETLLAGIEKWGAERTLRKAVGMFAFALWDRAERTLVLARDRMGEKPIYYGWQRNTFLFGSELTALRAHPAFQGEIDRDALTLLLRLGNIPSPYCIYRGIRKLPPGTMFRLAGNRSAPTVRELREPEPFWSLRAEVARGRSEQRILNDHEAVEALQLRLNEAVGQQMIADVPLGALLSGGVDSSTVTALMQAQSSRPVKTFTIGFRDQRYNEAEYAKSVARHLGTEHTELYVTPDDARAVIPRLPALYSEPFADASQVPTFLVAQLARQKVTVALSGDAGDELFGGYNHYFWGSSIWQKLVRPVPSAIRSMAAEVLTAVSPRAWNRLFGSVAGLLPSRLRVAEPGDKALKLARLLVARSPEDIYCGLLSHWNKPSDVVIGATEPPTLLTTPTALPELPEFEHRMMYFDQAGCLPDDILVKVDRAAMGVSLETRAPYLDHRVVELAWRLPLSMKMRHGQGKWVLRQVLYKYVPKALIERPKKGFGVPIDAWLRGPLRPWAEELLDQGRLKRQGFFNPDPIRRRWAEHVAGARNWQYCLWDVLMFQAWLDAQ